MSNIIPFSISEFCKTPDPVPQEVADKILDYHISQVLPWRLRTGNAVTASENSGWRPPYYEKAKKRNGKSQHCFLKNSKGAVDWTTIDLANLPSLLEHLRENTKYTRICYYPNNGFIHADYKYPERGRRYFECDSLTSEWVFKEEL